MSKTLTWVVGAAAAIPLLVLAVPVIAGTALGGATVTNPARGQLDGKFQIKANKNEVTSVVAANINLPAGTGGIDWHVHPGETVGIVTGGGTLTILTEDCEELVYETGDTFVAPHNTHTARNFSDQPITVRATFFLYTEEGAAPPPPTIFVDQELDDVLDDRCGLID